ncbi:MAG: rRNA pseudouridine synthase [Chloroflexi bacterium]|nr:rRNA pseudouridine synthase [Chloroflexota bacterium]
MAYMSTETTLLKYLTESGLGSRRKLADAIRHGRVQVNESVAENFKQKIDPVKDVIKLDGQQVSASATETICLMFHKPAGIITTTSDEKDRRTVLDFIPERYRAFRLYPVGRLDKDSTGLLLLTNNGDLTYQLTHPKFEHEKEYLIGIPGSLNAKDKQTLQKGMKLSDGMTYPAHVKPIQGKPPFNYSITIHEGRNRQLRRMFEELGYPVLALKRVRIGKLRLGNLKEGAMREVTIEIIR